MILCAKKGKRNKILVISATGKKKNWESMDGLGPPFFFASAGSGFRQLQKTAGLTTGPTREPHPLAHP
jgi:hypothetical protein